MSKKYNWGIIGPGRIARKFAADLQRLPNANLYAVASQTDNRAEDFAKEFNVKKVSSSYEALASDPEIDIVYISTLHTGHYRDTMLCLKHGKNVLCEKPVAINSSQFEQMITLAQKKEVFFMEALWTRFVPSFQKCLELLQNGAIGDLRMINADFCINPPYTTESRLFNPNMGGGSLLDIGIYPVFLALEAAGPAHSIKAAATLDRNSIDTIFSAIFQHSNGVQSLLCSASRANARIEALLSGSKGMLKLNKCWHMPTTLELIHDGQDPISFTFDTDGSGYQYEAAEVMRCCEEGKKESALWSWEKSRRLIQTLDVIRAQTGIRYPESVEHLIDYT